MIVRRIYERSASPNEMPISRNSFSRGNKIYELSNHLGNVLSTISDRKLQDPTANWARYQGTYLPEVLSYSDYYPFGWEMPGRSATLAAAPNGEKYRFGFNGQEEDPEFWDGAVSFKYRVEDARVGRFFSVDPLTKDYPELTPYQVASNTPIMAMELEGLEGVPSNQSRAYNSPNIGVVTARDNATHSDINFMVYHNIIRSKTTQSEVVLKSPVGNAPITSMFGADRAKCEICSKTHPGTDYGVKTGTPVYATANGVVARSYHSKTMGNTVVIDHGSSSENKNEHIYTVYGHGSELIAKAGSTVNAGDKIMLSGNTGNSTGPHLHYEVALTDQVPTSTGFWKNKMETRKPADELSKLLKNFQNKK